MLHAIYDRITVAGPSDRIDSATLSPLSVSAPLARPRTPLLSAGVPIAPQPCCHRRDAIVMNDIWCYR